MSNDTEMTGMDPGEDPGFHPLQQGDIHDDDAQAVDEYFQPAYHGPVESESYALGVEETAKTTRLLSRSIFILPAEEGGQPLPFFNADPNRLHIRIAAETDIRIASDKTDLNGSAVLTAGQHWTNDYHTGAIWIDTTSPGGGTVAVWVTTC